MQVLQRVLLIIMAIGIMLTPGYFRYQQKIYFLQTWKMAEEERFFETICRRGYVTAEEYELYYEKMQTFGTEKFCFQEYRPVVGPDGQKAYELILWEEILEELKQGEYTFQTGSEVRLDTGETIYYGLSGIGGKDR